jgi:putative phage-type endonuclease
MDHFMKKETTKNNEGAQALKSFPEWTPKAQLEVIGFENRGEGIGGSEVAAILGLSPWQKPFDVWARKTGQGPEQEVSEAMEWGTRLEGAILEKYQSEVGKKIFCPGDLTLKRKDRPWHIFTCDALHVENPVGVEAKTASGFAKGWGDPGTDQIPEYYLTQIMWYMAGLDAQSFRLVVLIDGRKYGVYTVERDQELCDILLEKVGEFWEKHIQADIPPEITHSDVAERYLKMKYPKAGADLRYADDTEISLATDLRDVRTQLAELDARKKDLETKLKERIGEDKGIDTPFGSLTWSGGNPTTKTSWKELALSFGPTEEQISEFSNETTTPRSFRVNFKD